MPVYTVKVKWGKETFKDVKVDTDGDIIDFKSQLFSLSNVPIERQKIMAMGKTLKDDEWNISLKNVSDENCEKFKDAKSSFNHNTSMPPLFYFRELCCFSLEHQRNSLLDPRRRRSSSKI